MLMITNNMEGFMQRRTMLGVLAVFLTIGVLLTLGSRLIVDSQSQVNSGFDWNDSWNNSNNDNIPNVKPTPVKPEPTPVEPAPKEQLIATSYQEALEMSAEKDMPIFIIFSGDSCSYCKRMKREVLPNQQVKEMMKNYVYLMVNTSDRSGQRIAKKYGLRYIPAFAITNSKEDKLKFEERYMSVGQLVEWLNNPDMFK